MPAVLDMAREIPMFAASRPEERVQFERLVERCSYPAGDEILREGETDQSLRLLFAGQCEVVKCKVGHGEQRLAVLEPGSVFGEMSFLQPAPHSATVRALTNVEVGTLSPTAFESLRRECPAAAYNLLMGLVTLLAERLRRMDDRICEVLEASGADHQKEWQDFRARLFAGWDFN